MLHQNLPKAGPRAIVIIRIMPSQLSPAIRIALVGMSGTGKTFWAKRLAASGHQSISCDDRIEERLRPHLAADGHTGTSGVAAWMGWPDSSTYAQRESDYLAAEIAALDDLLTELERNPSRELVLDTTGSVIYTGNNVLMRLRRQMTIVYLAASAEEQQLLIKRYLTDPKPVLWRGAFQPKNGESPHETVARCYPTLVAARRQSYEALAHCTLPVADLHSLSEKSGDAASVAEAFLERIRSQIGKKSGRANGL
jgi:shikimate kinase